MHNLKIFKGQFPKKRFWELFSPCTITFGFWLATASFCFFAYQSLLPPNMEGIVNWTAGVLSIVFLIFGIACTLVVVYLVSTWILGIRITQKKTKAEEIEQMKSELESITKRADELRMFLNDVQNEHNSSK